MTAELTVEIKQEGARAFSDTLGMGTYDVLLDEWLCDDLTSLWDCATLATLQTCVANNRSRPAAQAFLQAVRAQSGGPPSRAKVTCQPQFAPTDP